MTTETLPGFLSTTELDFSGVRDQLINFLRQQDRFKDYNFEGSNLRVLIDLLAYNTHLNAQYLHMVGSEMFLDTAQLRESVVSHAKELNYTPRSRSSAVAYVTLRVNANTGPTLPETVVVPRYFPLRAIVDGTQYTFTTNDVFIARRSNNYRLVDVPIYEGNVVHEFFEASANPRNDRFLISSPNVDTSSIRVNVRESSSSSANSEWTVATSLLGLTPDSPVFFIQGAEDFRYELTFGNGVTGKAIKPGNIIRVTYRDTAGPAANGIRSFQPLQSVEGYSVVVEAVTAPAQFGQDHESTEDIKYYAPKFFTTQDRAVTQNDFIVLLRSKFPGLEAVTAYGGELVNPPIYGKVVVSAKPYGGTVLPQQNKRAILEFLKQRASLAIDPIFVDPDYIYVGVASNVKYNANRTTLSRNDIQSAVVSSLIAYGNSNLNQFNARLRYSKVVQTIDAANPSIISNDTEVRMIKKWTPPIRSAAKTVVDFTNAIDTVRKDASVYSSPFQFKRDGATYFARLEDNRRGGIDVVYTVPATHQREVLQSNVGVVDYAAGRVTISGVVIDQYDGAAIDLFALPAQRDIDMGKNQILILDPDNIIVTATAVRE